MNYKEEIIEELKKIIEDKELLNKKIDLLDKEYLDKLKKDNLEPKEVAQAIVSNLL